MVFTSYLLDSGEILLNREDLNGRSGYAMVFTIIPKDGDFIISEIVLQRTI